MSSDQYLLSDQRERKILAFSTWLTLLLVPVYGTTNTKIWYGTTEETVFLWSWMGIIKYQVNDFYNYSEQVTVIGFPWIFILHIPSYYLVQQSWKIYKDNSDRVIRSIYGIVAIIVQLLLIYMSFHSQDLDVVIKETVRAFYFPQWILIIVYGVFATKWFTEESKRALEKQNTNEKEEPPKEGEFKAENS